MSTVQIQIEMTPTQCASRLAEFAADLMTVDLPDSTLNAAKSCLLDWMGVAIAGSNHELAKAIRKRAPDIDGATTSSASIIGNHRCRSSVTHAAFANAFAGHIFDFDDVYLGAPGSPIHPSAVVAPLALACGQWLRSSGEKILRSFIAGVEVECRFAKVLGAQLAQAGWHSTAIAGTLGASVVSGLLMGMRPETLLQSLLLATTQVSGLRRSFGSPAKPFQVAQAAVKGFSAAEATAVGCSTSLSTDPLSGFLTTYGADPGHCAKLVHGLGDSYAINDVIFKWHPCCGETHSAIDAACNLHGQFSAEKVRAIRVAVPPQAIETASFGMPANEFEARFSLPYCVASALHHGHTSLTHFTDAAVRDRELSHLVGLVQLDARPNLTGAVVELFLEGANTLKSQTNVIQWARKHAIRHELVRNKFVSLTSAWLGTERSQRLRDEVLSIQKYSDVGALFDLISV